MPPELSAADRNREDVLAVLHGVITARGTILEIASGGGQHAAHLAAAFPDNVWQPSDIDPDRIALMGRRFESLELPNLRTPMLLDVGALVWPVEATVYVPPIVGIMNVNMIHIAPWSACLSLLAGAARILPSGGFVYLYGPFNRDGAHTSAGNAAFDRSLRGQNPEWGLRELSDVCDAAVQSGLVLDEIVEMPVNNLSLVFRVAD